MSNPCQTAGCVGTATGHSNFCLPCSTRIIAKRATMFHRLNGACVGLTNGEQNQLHEDVVDYVETWLLDQVVFRCVEVPDEMGGEG